MSTLALNNLWSYLQGLSLGRDDREWLASKLLEPTAEDAETIRQQGMVKESLYKALDEVSAAKQKGQQLQSLNDFIAELQAEVV